MGRWVEPLPHGVRTLSRRRPAIPCAAHSVRTGQPCRNFAMLGATVCHAHGGRTGQARAAAQQRLERAKVGRDLARHRAQQRAEQDALAPWASELEALRFESLGNDLIAAKRARELARELARAVKVLREYAKAVEAEEAR